MSRKIINLRGGLGNQIIQISYILNNKENLKLYVNYNSAKLKKQLSNIEGISYINSSFYNILFGSIRKILSKIKRIPIDINIQNIHDGYFSYGEITNIIPNDLKEHLRKQIYFDNRIQENIDIVIHIRGGDYLSKKNKTLYKLCDSSYYRKAIDLSEKILNLERRINIFIVSNDWEYAQSIIESVIDRNRYRIIKYSKGEWLEFSLIYRATIAIISNSTFSMTARMIKESSITIAPRKWYKRNISAPFNNKFIYLE